MNYNLLVVLGSIVQSFGVLSYIILTLKGKIKPNRITWLFWSFAPLISFFISYSLGGGYELLPVFISGFGPFLVFIATFFNKKSYWKLGSFDYICGFLSLLALVCYLVTKDAVLSIFFAILADFFPAIPTLKKSYFYPKEESLLPHAGGLFSYTVSVLWAERVSFIYIGFNIYLLLISLVFVSLISRKFWQK